MMKTTAMQYTLGQCIELKGGINAMIVNVIGNKYRLYLTNTKPTERDWGDHDIVKEISAKEFWERWRQSN